MDYALGEVAGTLWCRTLGPVALTMPSGQLSHGHHVIHVFQHQGEGGCHHRIIAGASDMNQQGGTVLRELCCGDIEGQFNPFGSVAGIGKPQLPPQAAGRRAVAQLGQIEESGFGPTAAALSGLPTVSIMGFGPRHGQVPLAVKFADAHRAGGDQLAVLVLQHGGLKGSGIRRLHHIGKDGNAIAISAAEHTEAGIIGRIVKPLQVTLIEPASYFARTVVTAAAVAAAQAKRAAQGAGRGSADLRAAAGTGSGLIITPDPDGSANTAPGVEINRAGKGGGHPQPVWEGWRYRVARRAIPASIVRPLQLQPH